MQNSYKMGINLEIFHIYKIFNVKYSAIKVT